MTRRSQRFRYLASRRPAAVVVALQEPHQSAHQVATSAMELARLARVLGIDVVRTMVQSRAQGSSGCALSEGRLRQLALLTGGPGPQSRGTSATSRLAPDEQADLVLVDGRITAGQQHALERACGVDVLDRTGVILRVFELRARSREARLQVELARHLYEAPRVRDQLDLGAREGGGGRGGRGHSNVELAKQHHRERVATLRRELTALPAQAAVRRQRRDALLQVALVGYTNAGKSSLMRGLTCRDVHVEDELFATVDLTVRALPHEGEPRILVSDTVGFIANLPHELVAAFRATLEEARHADLLLVIVDASDPSFHEQLHVTGQTLRRIGAEHVPKQLVFTKLDRLDAHEREMLALTFPDAVLVSAHDVNDMAALRAHLVRHFEQKFVEGTVVVPYAEGALLGEIHQRARVLSKQHTARGTALRVRAPSEAWARWRKACAASS